MSDVAKHVEDCGCVECGLEALAKLDRLRVEHPAAFEEATKHFTHCTACRSINIERRSEPVPHRHYRHCNTCGLDMCLSEPLAVLTHAVGNLEAEVRRTAAIPSATARAGADAPPTPAAMLGEALGHVQRAIQLLAAAGHTGVGSGTLRQEVMVGDLRNTERNLLAEIEGLKREAEAREGRCPHCGNPTNFRDAHLCVKRESP